MNSTGTGTTAPSLHKERDYNVPIEAIKVLPRDLRGWRRIVHGFTPNWFSVTMGTGIVSILFYMIPFQGPWLYWLSVLTFLLNVVLFTIFCILTTLRHSLYPHLFIPMLKELPQSLFLGAMPIGLSTIITMLVEIGEPVLGQPIIITAWALWWLEVTLSMICCYTMPFLVMYAHKKELQFMTATWLLPVISTIVTSATGATVAEALSDPQMALWTLTACYILWGSGLVMALSLLVIYLLRLTLYRFPPRENVASVFIPLGPLGQAAFAIQKLGLVAREIFLMTNTLENDRTGAGDILFILGWAVALPLWGFSMVWLTVAVVHIFSVRFPFNMGWWAFTFPLGTVALATLTIGSNMPSPFFEVLGTIFSVIVILLWMICSAKTVHRAWTGDLFPKH